MWKTVIGLEVHARLLTRTKIFCGCSTEWGASPNSQTCPVCLGYPGALPVLNGRAVELAVAMALATNCTVHPSSRFARKNYFYPDLPKGYQITQYDRPLATGGFVDFTAEGAPHRVRIRRIHLEEDAGKLLHDSADGSSLLDLNRAGTPLIEIVAEPEIHSPAAAISFLNRLRQILMYTGVCDGNMEEGSLRCDGNISLHRPGEPLGRRVEIKNLNSFRFLGRAIEFEIERQSAVLSAGGSVAQETRLFYPAAGETRPMRSKEEAHDYRYLDEPDLRPLVIADDLVDNVRRSLPELPGAKARRYVEELAIPAADAETLVASRELAEYFEAVVAGVSSPRMAANWVKNELLGIVKERGLTLGSLPLTPPRLASLISMVEKGEIGGKVAKEVFEEIVLSGETPEAVVERKGLRQISDPDTIRNVALEVIETNRQQAEEYRAGRANLFGFFVGRVMKQTGGRANAELANRIVRELLDSR